MFAVTPVGQGDARDVGDVGLVADRENVSITEALRRLVGYGELIYRAVQVDGNDDILVRRGWDVERIVLEQVT